MKTDLSFDERLYDLLDDLDVNDGEGWNLRGFMKKIKAEIAASLPEEKRFKSVEEICSSCGGSMEDCQCIGYNQALQEVKQNLGIATELKEKNERTNQTR